MDRVILILALSCSLAGAVLAPCWGYGSAQRGGHPRLALLAGAMPLLLGLLVLVLVPIAPNTPQIWLVALLAAMALHAVQALVFFYWNAAHRQSLQPAGLRRIAWIGASLLTQLMFVSIAARLIAVYFAGKYLPFFIASPLSPLQMHILLTVGLLTAGLLFAAATAAAVEGLQADEVLIHDEVDYSGFAERDLERTARLRRLAEWLLMALLARGAAIGLSLTMAALANPINPAHFFGISLAPSSSLLVARLLIGLGLPLLYTLMALLALRGATPHEGARHFAPALLMIVLTEILAAALTIGNWGIAF